MKPVKSLSLAPLALSLAASAPAHALELTKEESAAVKGIWGETFALTYLHCENSNSIAFHLGQYNCKYGDQSTVADYLGPINGNRVGRIMYKHVKEKLYWHYNGRGFKTWTREYLARSLRCDAAGCTLDGFEAK